MDAAFRCETEPDGGAWSIRDSVANAAFKTTQWTAVFEARAGDPKASSAALDKLARSYWPPIYVYLRRRGYSQADAQDYTQEFFAQLSRPGFLEKVRHQEGKFRSFLLTCLNHFLANQHEKQGAQKRGGGRPPVPLENLQAEEDQALVSPQLTPEQAFDRRWANRLIQDALERLRREYEAEGKGELFRALQQLDPAIVLDETQAKIGERLGMSPSAVKSAAHRLRSRYRQTLRALVAETLEPSMNLEDEIRSLIQTLSD